MAETIPPEMVLRELSAQFNHNSIPRSLSVFSSMPANEWARVVVREGEIFLLFGGEEKARCLLPDEPGIIPPTTRFRIAATGKTGSFQIFYYNLPPNDDAVQLAGLLAQGAADRRGN